MVKKKGNEMKPEATPIVLILAAWGCSLCR